MGVTFLDANGLDTYNKKFKNSIGLDSNDGTTNSVAQISNKAVGDHSVALGKDNITLSENSFSEGYLNISGIQFKKVFGGIYSYAYRVDNAPNGCDLYIAQAEESDINIGDTVAVQVGTDPSIYLYWFSAKVLDVSKSEEAYPLPDGTGTYYGYKLTLSNIQLKNAIEDAQVKNDGGFPQVSCYIANTENLADSCHTEHLEGAYNIAAATGDGVFSSRASHIEGHTNISFGQYNHIEGVRNRALDKTQMTHIEGRFNTTIGGNLSTHVEGESNKCIDSSYTHVEGIDNEVVKSSAAHIGGRSNSMINSAASHVGGDSSAVIDAPNSFVHGDHLKSNIPNQVVFGQFNDNSSTSSLMIGAGTEDERKNIFEVTNSGDVKFIKDSELVSLNTAFEDVDLRCNNLESDLREAIYQSELKAKLIGKTLKYSDNVSRIFYQPKEGILKISKHENVSSAKIFSKNILDTNYTYSDRPSVKSSGLTFKSDINTGIISVSGEYEDTIKDDPDVKKSWPQYTMFTADKNPFYFEPGVTYILGVEDDSETIEFRLAYKRGDGATMRLSAFANQRQAITWDSSYAFSDILIQAKQQNYDSAATIKPYIYIQGNSEENWSQNRTLEIDLNTSDIIDNADGMNGQILFNIDTNNKPDLQIDTYVDESVTKSYVDNKISDGLNSYNILVVDELPETQDPRTIYLVKE